jgi:hypothetical protein
MFGAPEHLTATFVSDGYGVLLQPLSNGTHTIRSFHAEFLIDGLPNVQDMTYSLTVN